MTTDGQAMNEDPAANMPRKQVPLYDYCEDPTGTDIDARRVPASVVQGRARHHVFEEMERDESGKGTL